MVSIDQLLRDARAREDEEKAEVERQAREDEARRAAALRREQERLTARQRAEDEERSRRAFEEQRRQAELAALQQATLERAQMEAGARARLAEIAARQEHERHLLALAHDGHKRRLQAMLAGLGVLLVAGAIGGGVLVKRVHDEKETAQATARDLERRIVETEALRAKVERDLGSATDPAVADALRARLRDQEEELRRLKLEASHPKAPVVAPPVRSPVVRPPPPPTATCSKGDPLCPTVN